MNIYLFYLTLSFIILTPIDYILFVKWMDSMEKYSWYASALVFPFFGIILYKSCIMVLTYKNILTKAE